MTFECLLTEINWEFGGIDGEEGKMTTWGNECPNYNHEREDAPVRFCPDCGEMLNEDIPMRKCKNKEHAISRRERDKYCVNCGE